MDYPAQGMFQGTLIPDGRRATAKSFRPEWDFAR